MQRRFQLVNVFSEQPLSGNPLAVIVDSEDLSTEEMQQIARWMNFSESAFLLPPTSAKADYKVRIFTLHREMPFAGHPTLGSCHAWLRAGGRPHDHACLVQECGAGLVRIRRVENRLAFAAPALVKSGPIDAGTLKDVAHVLRIRQDQIVDAQWADNGPGWIAVLLDNADTVISLEPVVKHETRIDIGVVGPYPAGSEFAFELRAFFSDHHGAIREDPVTGSLNASVAQCLLRSGRASSPYVASQGRCLGRAGHIHIAEDDDGSVWVGGRTTTIVDGELNI